MQSTAYMESTHFIITKIDHRIIHIHLSAHFIVLERNALNWMTHFSECYYVLLNFSSGFIDTIRLLLNDL